MADTFRDKVALVIGGGSGIGRATTLAFARAGPRVVVADLAEAGGHDPRPIPLEAPGRPDEIAAAVLWLRSDSASFTTGHPLILDGGLTA